MENTLIWIICTLAAMVGKVDLPEKPCFSDMEINHIRVATPGLFADGNSLILHLDSLAENEYSFPLPGAKVIQAMALGEGTVGSI